MVDLVEHLKERAKPHERGFPMRLLYTRDDMALDNAAAAEILRLRAEVERLTQSRDGYAKQAAARAHECDRIRAEERERAAQIAEQTPKYVSPERIAAAIRASKDAGGGE